MPITQSHVKALTSAGRSCLDAYKDLSARIAAAFQDVKSGKLTADDALNDLFSSTFHIRPSVEAPELIAKEETHIKYTEHRNLRNKLRLHNSRRGLPTRFNSDDPTKGFQPWKGRQHTQASSDTYPEVAAQVPEAFQQQDEDVLVVTSTDVPPDFAEDILAQPAFAHIQIEPDLPTHITTKALGEVVFEPDEKAMKPGEDIKLKL